MDYTDRYGNPIIIKDLTDRELKNQIKKFKGYFDKSKSEYSLSVALDIKIALHIEEEKRKKQKQYYQKISSLSAGEKLEEVIIF
jgi:hypothetical protein